MCAVSVGINLHIVPRLSAWVDSPPNMSSSEKVHWHQKPVAVMQHHPFDKMFRLRYGRCVDKYLHHAIRAEMAAALACSMSLARNLVLKHGTGWGWAGSFPVAPEDETSWQHQAKRCWLRPGYSCSENLRSYEGMWQWRSHESLRHGSALQIFF